MRSNSFARCGPSGNTMIDSHQLREYHEQDADEAYEQRREDDLAIPVDAVMKSAKMFDFIIDKLFGEK